MLMMASSSKVPKLMSRRDLRTVGTLIAAAGIVMIIADMCSKSSRSPLRAGYKLNPSPIEADGTYAIDREISSALLDTSKVSLECCDSSPYSSSGGCICDAQEFVKGKSCEESSFDLTSE